MRKTAFIGHRLILQPAVKDSLVLAIEEQIRGGCNTFTMSTHGEFDKLALNTCLELKHKYPDIKIEIVITNLNSNAYKYGSNEYYTPYSDIETIMYEIETVHYKQQITASNRQMIDTCDTLICYVDEDTFRSGAKTAMQYAKKNNLNIINLYYKSALQ